MANSDPCFVLRALRAKNFDALTDDDRAAVCRMVRRIADPLNAMAEADFLALFNNFLAVQPEPFLAGVGEFLPEDNVQLEELVLGGNPPIRCASFVELGLANSTVTMVEPKGRPPYLLVGDEANTFRNNVRLIANVLLVLGVTGPRVIRGSTLLDIVRSRHDNGRHTGRSITLLLHMNTVSALELWGSNGLGYVVKKVNVSRNDVDWANLALNGQGRLEFNEDDPDSFFYQVGFA